MSQTGQPFFSIVIPTRDRPQYVAMSLEILMEQSFKDFEVIVSDNFTEKPCYDEVRKINDKRVRYIQPEKQLQMADNWEFACEHARGSYVSVLIDKTFLHTGALEILHRTLIKKDYDIVTWWSESFVPFDETREDFGGYYNPQYQAKRPEPYSPQQELHRRFSCKEDLWEEGINYFRGKICFGAFSSSLLNRIKERQGKVFELVCPDYTATISALALAENAIDIGQPLMVSFLTEVSNGMNYIKSSRYAYNFLCQVDPAKKIINELPVKGLYSSTHNLIAGDYERVRRKLGNTYIKDSVNVNALIQRIINDMAIVGYDCDEDFNDQLSCLSSAPPNIDIGALKKDILSKKKTNAMTAGLSPQEQANIYEQLYMKFKSPLLLAKWIADYHNRIHEAE